MTYGEIVSMINEMGMPYAYNHFAEGQRPATPFIVFNLPRSDHFSADGGVFKKLMRLEIDLYSALKAPNTEKTVEDILDTHNFFYEKREEWLSTDKYYLINYAMEVIYDE